jgi:hypothetical protein
MIRRNAPDSLIAKANLAFEVACRIVIDRARQSGIYVPEQYPVVCKAPHYQAINVQDWPRGTLMLVD